MLAGQLAVVAAARSKAFLFYRQQVGHACNDDLILMFYSAVVGTTVTYPLVNHHCFYCRHIFSFGDHAIASHAEALNVPHGNSPCHGHPYCLALVLFSHIGHHILVAACPLFNTSQRVRNPTSVRVSIGARISRQRPFLPSRRLTWIRIEEQSLSFALTTAASRKISPMDPRATRHFIR
jgi:hypothetical protein